MKRKRKDQTTHNEVLSLEDERRGGVRSVLFDLVERDGVADFDLGSGIEGSHDGVFDLNELNTRIYARGVVTRNLLSRSVITSRE